MKGFNGRRMTILQPMRWRGVLAEMEVMRGIAEGLDAVMVNPCVVLGPGSPAAAAP